MKTKKKTLLISSILATSILVAAISVSPLYEAISISSKGGERTIAITHGNTIHRLYQTSTPGFPEYRRIVVFEMPDKQAYGYVSPSQAQTVDDDPTFLMTMWHANPSGAGFVINGDEHSLLELYFDYDRTQLVNLVKFRTIIKVDFEVDTSDDYRYVDLIASTGDLSYVITDEVTRLYTWTPTNTDDYQQTQICGAPDPKGYIPPHDSRVLWIRSMTFYYSC